MAYSSDPSHPSGGGVPGCDLHRLHGYQGYRDPFTGKLAEGARSSVNIIDGGCRFCIQEGRDDASINGYVCPCGPKRPSFKCTTCPPCKICSAPPELTEEEVKRAIPLNSKDIRDIPTNLF